MSIIFQLFSAEDLKQLNNEQYVELRESVVRAVENSPDTSLKASLTIAQRIQSKHLPTGLNPGPSYTGKTSAELPAEPVEIFEEDVGKIPPGTIDMLRKRVNEVFQQLTGRLPSGTPNPSNSTVDDLVKELLTSDDKDELEKRVGEHGPRILISALICELANFKTYEALKVVKEEAEETFMRLMDRNGKGRQRPKGPDLLYSPFHPLSPLYPDRPGQNP